MGLGRLAGGFVSALTKGKTAQKMAKAGDAATDVAQSAATSGNWKERLKSAYDNPVVNYGTNTAIDAGMGMLYGQDPVSAVGQAAVGNLGATAIQAGTSRVMQKAGVGDSARMAIDGIVVNPLGYAATDMVASRLMPGLYGGRIGQEPEMPTQQVEGQPGFLQYSAGLTPEEQFALQQEYAQRQNITAEQKKKLIYDELSAELSQSIGQSGLVKSRIDPTSTINMVY